MNIDWIVTIALFLVFVAWSFTFYASLFTEKGTPLQEEIDTVNDKIMDFLKIDVYNVPIRYNSTNETENAVLYLNFTWPSGTKNSTRILQDSTSLSCQFIGDTVYWQADLINTTFNYFSMQFSNKTASLNCTSSFSIQDELKTISWAMEKKKLVSQGKIDEMTALSYTDFKNNLSISRDFRVEINISGTETNYGKTLPLVRDIYVKETESELEETGDNLNVRVLVW